MKFQNEKCNNASEFVDIEVGNNLPQADAHHSLTSFNSSKLLFENAKTFSFSDGKMKNVWNEIKFFTKNVCPKDICRKALHYFDSI